MLLLTATFREVQDQGQAGAPPVLLHAPWLRLRVEASVPDDGRELVLARVGLDAGSAVTALDPTRRRLAGLPAARIELRRPVAAGGATPSVGQQAAAVLAVPDTGGVSLTGTVGGPEVLLLSIDAAFATASLLPAGGRLALGIAGPPQTVLHVEGDQGVHSGGTGGGFSFADRTVGGFVGAPTAGQRWVWYASGGTARLWSGRDLLTVGTTGEGLGLDVARRMRVRQGGDASAGLWFFQDGTASDRAFVGMANDSEVGFYGVGVGWGLKMNVTSNGAVSIPNNLSVGNTGDAANNTALSVTSGPGGAICAISQTGTAIRAVSSNGTGLWVGGFTQLTGDVDITGRLVGGDKQFKIDHPLDPENKYLSHTSIESSEQLTCYSDNVVLDDDGRAEVRLPDWMEALVTDFRYQLTCISRSEPVYIAREVTDGSFAIAGGTAGLKVSWQLTGVRHDVWAQANELVVEEDKAEAERGYYRHPEAFGHGLERSVHWPRNEELIRQHPRTAQHFVRAQALMNAERVAAQAARRGRPAER
jgi:hypothetical protein